MYIYNPGLSNFQQSGATVAGWDRLSSVHLGQPALPLPRVTAERFSNGGTVDPENCCRTCIRAPTTNGRLNLGVGLRGAGQQSLRAANGMEWAFTISGNRPGIDYDILRRARHSLWERVGGVWRNLENLVRDDDTNEDDECLRPSRSNRIFVIDRPGWSPAVVPTAAADFFFGFTNTPANPVRSDPAATELVLRASFAEWVQGRSKTEGIPWTPLELPPFPNGTKRTQYTWNSIMWLIRNNAGQWIVGPRSVIRRGPIARDVMRAAPV
jgi:hypothetical protein